MNLDFPTSGDVVFKDEVTGEDFNFSNELDSLFNASSDEEVTKLQKSLPSYLMIMYGLYL